MKKRLAVLFGLLAALIVLGSCDLFLGPDEPAGDSGGTGGNLLIRVGSAGDESRAVTSGADLPSGVLNSLRYELTLTGPGGEVLEQTVTGGETLSLTVGLGEWRIAARAYKEDGLAGTGSLSITVVPGLNSVRVPMNINGGYFDITVDASMVNGTVAANWDAAFPEATVTLTVMPDPGYILKEGTLTYHYGSSGYEPGGSGLIYTFAMPAADVAVSAEFEELPPDVYSITTAASHGTVNPDIVSAVAGTPVTLTVTADPGYILQPGSVKYSDGSDHAIAGPPYTFTMPASHVTVSAGFEAIIYTITAAASHGTVIPSVTSAPVGTLVTLTITAGSGYVLQPGSVKYSDGTDHAIAGPPYTFTMPASHVTVSAQFSQLSQYVRYVRAGFSGDGTSWENASGDLQKMMDELEAVSGYTGPRIVKVGAGAYKPKYKPEASPGPYTYTPGNRDSAFILREGVQVWGGYTAGGEDIDEATRKSRFGTYGEAATVHKAILSGDLNNSGGIPDTSDAYHVVLGVDIPANSETVLDGLTISGGNADGSSLPYTVGITNIGSEYGGGMYNYNASPKLTRVTISGNNASNAYGDCSGGGMSNGGGSSPALENVTISGNQANRGGGIYNSGSSPVLVNVTISGNTATGDGGGMYNDNSSPELTGVTIGGSDPADKNTAANGGGMYNINGSSPTMTGGAISGNTVSGTGGGMYNNNSSPVLKNGVTISNNTAAGNGGGMYNYNSSPVLIGVTISENKTTIDNGGGGGMYNYGSSPVLIDVTISKNETTGTNSSGGGMSNSSSSSPVLINVTISGNTTSSSSYAGGGGMRNYDSSPVLINVRISGNKVTSVGTGSYGNNGGGGMYNYNSSPKLINVTISGNWVQSTYGGADPGSGGGGMYNYGSSSPATRNSIIWGNAASTGSPGIEGSSGSIEYSMVEGSTAPVGTGNAGLETGAAYSPFTDWKDPGSAPTTEGDYRLNDTVNAADAKNKGLDGNYPTSANDTSVFPASLSATVKAAIDAALGKDLGGNVRTQGTIDMGAYEKE